MIRVKSEFVVSGIVVFLRKVFFMKHFGQMKMVLLLVAAAFSCIAYAGDSVYLFNAFPGLQAHLPHISICDLPTPITRLEQFSDYVGCKNVYMKADSLTGKRVSVCDGSFHLYGGNKPRKLEFLFADAQAQNATTIVTYGCAGSNHALATAVYARELGFNNCVLMLKNQPNSPVVRHNLLLDWYCGAELRFFPNNQVRSTAAAELMNNVSNCYLIPTGGSNEIGAIGFVNAAFELKDQINQGLLQEPDVIYIPVGSCGTTAGLLLGLQAAGLKSKLIAVGVEPEDVENEFHDGTKALFIKCNALLNSLDSSFSIFEFPEDQLTINKKFEGTQYGLFTPEAVAAIKLINRLEGIRVEGTYSAKPIAAIMDDLASGALTDETILYWNTFCGIDYSDLTRQVNYQEMPVEFQRYFETDIQPLSVGMYE